MFRRLFNRSLWLSAIGLLLLGYATLIEPSRLLIRNVDFVSTKYSGPELRIALVTDIHINSASVPPRRVREIVREINAQKPDIVLMPGDFIAGHTVVSERSAEFNSRIQTGIAALEELNSPAFAVIGNHDRWYDADHVRALLEAADVAVLENESARFGALCLVGLADAMTAQPDRRAYSSCATGTVPLIITHSPDAWPAFRDDAVLAVAGHTHGGQVNLPIFGRSVNSMSLGREHSYGFSQIAGVDMFVSAGVGTSILPVRFRAPPEVVILTLSGEP